MRLSEFFTKTIKEVPSDEAAVNAKLLIRGGFINKVMAGVYEFLPLGLRVLNKINAIIREEMNAIGGQELYMSVLQNKETWNTTGRWQSAGDVMYQFEDASGREIGLGWTHEEPLTSLARRFIQSYKDLPRAVYQIQTKFRNEPRAKSGLIRGREFLMKDLYSFHADEADLDKFYEKVAAAYGNIFRRVGLDARRTLASGGLFSEFSDEFQVLTDAGEDIIFYCSKCDYTANKEIAEKLELKDACPKCSSPLANGRSVEVGNIFKLGTKFSEAFGLTFSDERGEKKPVIMASYGIGPGRLMGTVVETSNDERGIIWPENISPYRVHLISLEETSAEADRLYETLKEKNIEVIYDDRSEKSAGEKFADADLIGIPLRIVVSKKTLSVDSVEFKNRSEEEAKLVALNEYLEVIK